MQLKDLHSFRGGLNSDDAPPIMPDGDYPDAINVRTGGSDQQHGEGPAETLQGEIEILINPDSLITYYGSAIGGQFVYSGYLEVQIGTQIWMKKNWDAAYPGSKVYNDDENNRDVYGGLYTHGQIMASDFCPDGWHVPTEAEVDILIAELLGEAVAGGKLKDIGWWDAPNTGADDSSGFKAMPGGGNGFDIIEQQQVITSFNDYFLPSIGELNQIQSTSVWDDAGMTGKHYWSSTEIDSTLAYHENNGPSVEKSTTLYVRAIRAFTSLTVYAVGDIGPAGGYIFWKSGNDYLETAPSDIVGGIVTWSNVDSIEIGATAQGTAIGTGLANTLAIINQAGHINSAAKFCNDLVVSATSYYGVAIGSDFVYDLLGSTGLLWLADEVLDAPYVPPANTIVVIHTKTGVFDLYMAGSGSINVDWGDGVIDIIALSYPQHYYHTYVAGDHILTIANPINMLFFSILSGSAQQCFIPITATKLTTIVLSSNELIEFTTYKEWDQIETFAMDFNSVTNLVIPKEWNLMSVCQIDNNPFTSFVAHREWWSLQNFQIEVANITSDVNINNILIELDNIASNNLTIALMDGGTNATPTGAGLAAKANMISEGKTVDTN